MGDFLFKAWYMIGILPFFIFNEASDKFRDFLKRKNIYQHWDKLHSLLLLLVFLLLVFYFEGFR